ncbi:hypothetical protein FDP25_13760 [Roseovarius sp. A21]|uniref:Uncharacterized protein n=1 Tax=Roseovarius bejariae TaxID=2576383 RepID=A0A844D2Q2_9RHOB|nr:hypothetical protein [Roseovarius bejariae]MRU16504.1 hypothetical protein [Roseovarius bejariae]
MVKAGVLDPTLNVDTRLFIDPLLLAKSRHPEIAKGARRTYEQHFTNVIKFLSRTTGPNDVAWRSAQRLLSFPEIKWSCLGYGAESVSGSGSGAHMTGHFIETAKQIVSLGVEDPDLFVAMALFEEGVGPDRISDMTTNVILGDLLKFNNRVLAELGVAGKPMQISLRNGKTFEATLPANPHLSQGEPVILVPADALRDLPVVTDWSGVADAASKNEQLRSRVNDQIAALWEVRSRKDKDKLRRWALNGRDEFETFLEMIKGADPQPYDLSGDPLGEVFWRRLATTLADQAPMTIEKPPTLDYAGVVSVVEQIIKQFQFLIEDRRFSEELYHAGAPRPEKAAQRLFFAVAHAYCKANNLDLTPEADTGNGPVDFKVSQGYAGRVLVEIKLSRNGKLVSGYTKQLETYKTAEEALHGYYVVVDVGQMGKKDARLLQIKNEAAERGEQVSPIVFVDGTRRASASKL